MLNPHVQLYARHSDKIKIVNCRETVATNKNINSSRSYQNLPHSTYCPVESNYLDKSNSFHNNESAEINEKVIYPDLHNKSCEAVTMEYLSKTELSDADIHIEPQRTVAVLSIDDDVSLTKKGKNKRRTKKTNIKELYSNDRLERLAKLKEFNRRVFEKNSRKIKLQQKSKHSNHEDRYSILDLKSENRKNFSKGLLTDTNNFMEKNFIKSHVSNNSCKNSQAENHSLSFKPVRPRFVNRLKPHRNKTDSKLNDVCTLPNKLNTTRNNSIINKTNESNDDDFFNCQYLDEKGNYNLLLLNKECDKKRPKNRDTRTRVSKPKPKKVLNDYLEKKPKTRSCGSSPSRTEANLPHSIYDLILECPNAGDYNSKYPVNNHIKITASHDSCEHSIYVVDNKIPECKNSLKAIESPEMLSICSQSKVCPTQSGYSENDSFNAFGVESINKCGFFNYQDIKSDKNEEFSKIMNDVVKKIKLYIPPLKVREPSLKEHADLFSNSNNVTANFHHHFSSTSGQIKEFDRAVKKDNHVYEKQRKSKEIAVQNDILKPNENNDNSLILDDNSSSESYSIGGVIKSAVEMNLKLLRFIEINEKEMDLWNESDDVLKETPLILDEEIGKDKSEYESDQNKFTNLISESKDIEELPDKFTAERLDSRSSTETIEFLIYPRDKLDSPINRIQSVVSLSDDSDLNYPQPISINQNLNNHNRQDSVVYKQKKYSKCEDLLNERENSRSICQSSEISFKDPPPLDFKSQIYDPRRKILKTENYSSKKHKRLQNESNM